MREHPINALIIDRKDAAARGHVRYFTGKPCIAGHVAERYTRNGGCVECVKAKVAAYVRKRRRKAVRTSEGQRMKVIHVPSVDCVIVAAEPMNDEQAEVFRRALIDALQRGPWPPIECTPAVLAGDSLILEPGARQDVDAP
ncbi:hypothetical protein [Burkholderia ambifaria]|uniref:hypothetical protein n=1 Tax=Burkholderia ambifaria TaxID=152480 RepID=UPI00158E31A3|nr:hypothetical protein [Burkholderia ambifaria]